MGRLSSKSGSGEREREIGKEQSFSQDWWAICIPARWAVHPANETRVGGLVDCGGMDTNSITTYRRLHVRSGQVKLPAPTFPFLSPLPAPWSVGKSCPKIVSPSVYRQFRDMAKRCDTCTNMVTFYETSLFALGITVSLRTDG